MSLSPVNYIENKTIIHAKNMNDIQQAIIANEQEIGQLSDEVDTKYQKPAEGIPSTDMTAAVQTSLGKANTAIQEHQSLAAYRTSAEQDVIDNTKYVKPSSGIPSTDMTSAVRTSLGKADTAYQKPSSGIPATDMASAVRTSLGKADSAYQKPSGGIPKTDLASSVQTSLSKADTALQEHQSLAGYRTASDQDVIDNAQSADIVALKTTAGTFYRDAQGYLCEY